MLTSTVTTISVGTKNMIYHFEGMKTLLDTWNKTLSLKLMISPVFFLIFSIFITSNFYKKKENKYKIFDL